ncbi:DNA excision repair protein ERCC-8-like [Anneissia japonica]|uniref:DNA excision repair protein ERCC-8-like n=1 Tax=Anneissia japonica TaxID=1529436 RepID=UPI001425772F|nr:DNA excision repair protein ERCC-8-like [Anneissia japonica]XP_033115098.1 DNA excision repair protein ERCC-8-like [Anneissia japonica]XP_033115099.1 DNA excision repair protein ERCC-8-like [Anneissia japonica]XP_033115100.1 DNA excision repair protein ERCC-8-like [Anneissia japonica]XP_033115101.1 DNA excision repair protein ERCC-8-like [Anneissia japonica]XP_033115103.1 DNA excision repair protein ERCC-8-like [Anneissia japonica]
MLKFLSYQERGILSSLELMRAEITRRIYSLELSKTRDVQRIHSGAVNCLDIDPSEGKYLLSGGADSGIVIYDIECRPAPSNFTCSSVCSISRSNKHAHKYSVETVQWYPHDTGMFTSSAMDNTLKVWDTNALVPAEKFTFEKPIYCHNMSSIAMKHCLICVGTASSLVTLCDLRNGSSTHTLKGHKGPVMAVKWSNKDEFQLATSSQDNRVMLWDIRRSKGSLMVLDQHNGEKGAASTAAVSTAHNGHVTGLCFTSDGLNLLSCGTDDRLRLWDVMTGRNTLINYGKILNNTRRNLKLCVSSDASDDLVFVPSLSDICVFEIHSGRPVVNLTGHYSRVNACTFHPLFQELYSAGNDSNILIWEPEIDRELQPTMEDGKKGQKNIADTWSSDED